jgi:16S rRNA (guanine(527)-N(7))-methyltransferase RsmG
MFHVKHLLEKALQELKITSTEEKTSLLLQYIEELVRWNKKINIISRKLSEEEVAKKLICPSLIPIKKVKNNEKVLDFGAGGGIASIPLKIYSPNIKLQFLESKNKPAVFLEHINSLLCLNAKITKLFVKTKNDLKESFDWVFIRAVDPEKVPAGLADKIIYYGKYRGEKFVLEEELIFNQQIISILS